MENEVELICSICGLKYWVPEWMFLEDLQFQDELVCPTCSGDYEVP